MTAERDGKSRRTGQPDLLASLPDERQVSGSDLAVIEKLLTWMRDLGEQMAELKEAVSAQRLAPATPEELREQFAGPREAESAERPAPVPAAVPQALTLEALEAWDDKFVTRVAEAARTADAPGDEAAAARLRKIEDAATKALAAAERIDRGLESTADRVVAEVGAAATRIEKGLAMTRNQVTEHSHRVHKTLDDIRTHTAGRRFGFGTVFVWLIVLVFGMLIESRILVLYRWLWSG